MTSKILWSHCEKKCVMSCQNSVKIPWDLICFVFEEWSSFVLGENVQSIKNNFKSFIKQFTFFLGVFIEQQFVLNLLF